MKIQTACEGCSQMLRVDGSFAGRKARCPSCGAIYVVPTLSDRDQLPDLLAKRGCQVKEPPISDGISLGPVKLVPSASRARRRLIGAVALVSATCVAGLVAVGLYRLIRHEQAKAAMETAIARLSQQRPSTESALTADVLTKTFAAVNAVTEADVQSVVSNAAASERVIMFIHVDWAIMEPQRTQFANFAIGYHRAYPNENVAFHYVDCTPIDSGYRPLRSLDGWSDLEDAAGTSLIHGWGEFVWLERGRVLHVQRIFDSDSTKQLIEKTESLMPSKDG